MDYDELFPGRFLKSGEFKGRDVTLTVARIRTEELPDEKMGMRMRGILAFEGTKKELVLNRTNGECIKAMFGRNTDEWIGKRITFFPAPHVDNFTGEKGTAIRVRGSPDLEQQNLTFELKLPRKKPVAMRLSNTAPKKVNGKPAAPKPPAPEPEAAPEGQLPDADAPWMQTEGQPLPE